jgi:adenosylhomocysteine nucleosidase
MSAIAEPIERPVVGEALSPSGGGNPGVGRIPGRDGSATVAIITIVDQEHDAVKLAGNFEDFIGDTAFLCRTKENESIFDIILAKSSDRSNIPCTELVKEIAERFRPEYILLSGIAGGVSSRDDVQLGDIVVADHVDWYEMRKMVDGRSNIRRQAFDHPSIFLRETITHRVKAKAKWIENIRVARPKIGKPKVIEGNLIAGDKILGDLENSYQKEILEYFDKALAVDMESYGLARGVYRARGTRHYNLNYLVIRGISDLVDQADNDGTRTEWRDYAAAAAAAFAMSVADEIVSTCK